MEWYVRVVSGLIHENSEQNDTRESLAECCTREVSAMIHENSEQNDTRKSWAEWCTRELSAMMHERIERNDTRESWEEWYMRIVSGIIHESRERNVAREKWSEWCTREVNGFTWLDVWHLLTAVAEGPPTAAPLSSVADSDDLCSDPEETGSKLEVWIRLRIHNKRN